MYSRPVKEPTEVIVPVLYINGKITDYTRFPNWKEGAVVNLFNYYLVAKKGYTIAGRAFQKRFGDNYPIVRERIIPSSENIQRFPTWMAGFLERCTHHDIYSYQMGHRKYRVKNRLINKADYEEIIRLDWRP